MAKQDKKLNEYALGVVYLRPHGYNVVERANASMFSSQEFIAEELKKITLDTAPNYLLIAHQDRSGVGTFRIRVCDCLGHEEGWLQIREAKILPAGNAPDDFKDVADAAIDLANKADASIESAPIEDPAAYRTDVNSNSSYGAVYMEQIADKAAEQPWYPPAGHARGVLPAGTITELGRNFTDDKPVME